MKKIVCSILLFYGLHLQAVKSTKPNHNNNHPITFSVLYLLCLPVSWKHIVTLPATHSNIQDKIVWDNPELFDRNDAHDEDVNNVLQKNYPRYTSYTKYQCNKKIHNQQNVIQQPSEHRDYRQSQKYRCEISEQKKIGNLRTK